MTYFGTNLKKIRQIKGLSQQAFAELIDLNRGVISSYEEGRAEPKIETLLRIATYFGIPTDDIISKPLTVNQLANFTLIEDSISALTNEISPTFQELTSNGEQKSVEMQKIFAHFDFVYFVDENIAKTTSYEKDAVLFLKEIQQEDQSANNYLFLENGKASISNAIVPTAKNYAVVGVLGSDFYVEQNAILKRLNLLEKEVFGK
ncbi:MULTISPECIES: helix-turn-helix domain-containing protein [unclassified Flavobacterium]|uniref:helix-turn-helix domain-containing protein n=1 Tax=unclassified Flavobacterium TaxID=196869 RepID=UPI0012914015|nr:MULTISPECIES: helix-turn-helix transcriptional regulator [unclassified Flavobacterium]MQP51392.1 helix-turn-helix domain-containing protein [Flavobacterium sp. LMO9]MQP61380.1 helix-turn-helix domain-containing protein [Flavobacterium sp. LMO6]